MKKVKNVVIGFGEGGKNLAIDLGKRGEETLLIEKDPKDVWWDLYQCGMHTSQTLIKSG